MDEAHRQVERLHVLGERSHRDAVHARLGDRGGFLGLDGPFRFGPGGVVERAFEVNEVRPGGVTVVSPAPTRFQD